MNRFAWIEAPSLSQAAAAATATVADAMISSANAEAGRAAILKAGGIDVLDLMKENLLMPGAIVNVRRVTGLDAIADEPDGGLRIGALATLASVAAHPVVMARYPALADALGNAASPQIRNVGTLGGNLLQRPRCWYFRSEAFHCLRKGGGHCFALGGENQYHAIFDNHPCAIVHPSTAATALVALGASAELVDAGKRVRRLALEEFFGAPNRDPHRENDLRPGEILAAIRLPPLAAGVRMAHLKQGERDSFDWPLADVAVVLTLEGGNCVRASIVLGAAAPVPHRARAGEQALSGKRVDESAAAQAARAAMDGVTPLAKNGYKVALFETLIRRAILQAVAAPDARAG
jgi:xanthine dehydrogenase YagS FAD-binding subunit